MKYFKLYENEKGQQFLYWKTFDAESEEYQIIGITHIEHLECKAELKITFESEEDQEKVFEEIDNAYHPMFFKPKMFAQNETTPAHSG